MLANSSSYMGCHSSYSSRINHKSYIIIILLDVSNFKCRHFKFTNLPNCTAHKVWIFATLCDRVLNTHLQKLKKYSTVSFQTQCTGENCRIIKVALYSFSEAYLCSLRSVVCIKHKLWCNPINCLHIQWNVRFPPIIRRVGWTTFP